MHGSLTLRGARLVLPDRVVTGDLLVIDGVIEQIGASISETAGIEIDAGHLTILPGAIDTLVAAPLGAADDGTPLSRVTGAALASGVTAMVLEDPANPVRTAEQLDAALAHAARHARTHFGIYLDVDPLDPKVPDVGSRAAGLRLRIGGRGTATMPDPNRLDAWFARIDALVVAEGQDAVGARAREALYADAHDPSEHGTIYEPALSARVVDLLLQLARRHGGPLHLPRVTSAAELAVLEDRPAHVTASAPVTHLALEAKEAVKRLRHWAVTDPPLRGRADVEALWDALADGGLDSVGSGHTAILAATKDVPYPRTPTGLPALIAWLPTLLEAVAMGRCSLVDVARWTAGEPARQLGLPRKGRLEVGCDADLVAFDLNAELKLEPPWPNWSSWSPFEGRTYRARPVVTIVGGRPVYSEGRLVDGVRGRQLAPHRRS